MAYVLSYVTCILLVYYLHAALWVQKGTKIVAGAAAGARQITGVLPVC